MTLNPVGFARRGLRGVWSRLSAPDFRRVVGLFATGVTVVTTRRGAVGRGMTANAFAAVSLDPMLVLVCVRQDSEMRRLLDELDVFAVSVLAADQEPVARWFANPARPAGPEQFDAVACRPGPATGAPLIDKALAWVECAVEERVPAGDHTILLGRVLSLGCAGGTEPLTFFGGSFGTVAPGRPVGLGRGMQQSPLQGALSTVGFEASAAPTFPG